ncbi:MAG: hypothetical protein HKO62_13890 [Gammaproteobacteria bacterium]|nr:hypothetical protein [Gammaproteobacteria bacterium]NNM01841.1 hypothetical protein [Gammaproteobacteria bacterium]
MKQTLVIKQHRPLRRVFLVLLIVVAAGAGTALIFDYGSWRYLLASVAADKDQRALLQQVRTLRQQNEQLKDRVDVLERTAQIDKQASRLAHVDQIDLRSTVAELRQELDFYRGIVAEAGGAKGTQVQALRFRAFDALGSYGYRLVLTHVGKEDKVAEGRVVVKVAGRENGADRSYDLNQLIGGEEAGLAFKFKHFRRLEGIVQLPEAFVPERVHVTVQDDRRRDRFERTYRWATLIDN